MLKKNYKKINKYKVRSHLRAAPFLDSTNTLPVPQKDAHKNHGRTIILVTMYKKHVLIFAGKSKVSCIIVKNVIWQLAGFFGQRPYLQRGNMYSHLSIWSLM